MTRRGWLLFIILGVVWGIPYLLIKVAVREVSPVMLVEMRTGGAALLLMPVAAASGQLRAAISRWKGVLLFSIVEMCVPWYMLFNAETKIASSLAGLLVAAVPIVGAVLARVTKMADHLDGRRVAGILVGLTGVAALVGFDVGHSDALAASGMAFVAIGYALGPWTVSRYLSDLPGLGVMALALAMSAVIYAPIAAFSVPRRSLAPDVVASVVTLVVVCTALAFLVFFELVKEIGMVRMTLITYVNPAVAVVLGVSILHERFGVFTGIGFVLIILGCLLATARPLPTAPIADSDGEAPVRSRL